MSQEASVNLAMLQHADIQVRRAVEAAGRGDADAQRSILRYAASEGLENHLKRLRDAADKCAPTTEEIKHGRGSFSADSIQLRHAVDACDDALSKAVGRAVVTTLTRPSIVTAEPDDSHDSGEFPRPPRVA